jgi:hypothetical protein
VPLHDPAIEGLLNRPTSRYRSVVSGTRSVPSGLAHIGRLTRPRAPRVSSAWPRPGVSADPKALALDRYTIEGVCPLASLDRLPRALLILAISYAFCERK